jgi:deazaflavin-dependent oxidoreductase (nitroreductase family)
MKEKPEFTLAEIDELAVEQRRDDGPGTARWNPDGSAVKTFNAAFIDEFRSNGGKIDGEIGFFDFLLVTARGAKSGVPRTVPLAYYTIEGRLVILASMGGSARNPPWYYNVVANPDVTVEIGSDSYSATAIVLEGADREEVFDAICEQQAVYREYQSHTPRLIPVIELKREG